MNTTESPADTTTKVQCACDHEHCPEHDCAAVAQCNDRAVRVVVLRYTSRTPGGTFEKRVRLPMCKPCADWWESTGLNIIDQGPGFGCRAAVLRIGPSPGQLIPVVSEGGSGQ